MELIVDTSSNTVGVALSQEGEILSELTWQSIQNQSVEFMPNLAYLLHQAKVELNSMEAIIVAKGPGSFNALRVGISIAKGLAFSLNIPLLGIGTLEAEAYPFAYTALPLCPIHRSGRDEIACAMYQQKTDEWQCLEGEHLTTLDILCQKIQQKTLFCGEIPDSMIGDIHRILDQLAIIPRTARLARVASLAMLGWQRILKGEQDDLAALQPLYLRPPHITKPRKGIHAIAQSKEATELNKAQGSSFHLE